MSDRFGLPLATAVATAITLASAAFLFATFASAEPQAAPNTVRAEDPKRDFAKPRTDGQPLDQGDELAALSSVQFALMTVPDGSTYVWHRRNGRLSGLVKPTTSFRSPSGAVCRNVIVMLTSGTRTEKVEGIACRGRHGVWSLEG
ncbi:MAG: hypothetical protein NW216_07920 [Hyphomicrobium sp.]|nr:hypothetical protein [Hyphomicrobium sp.]